MTEKLFSRPLVIWRGRSSDVLEIGSVEQAANFLMADWSGERDERHRDALDACLKVLDGHRSTVDAEKAVREAALLAGILVQD